MAEVPMIDIGDFINDKATVGSKLVNQILKGLKFKPVEYVCSTNKNDQESIDDLHLEETFVYGDIMYSMEEDKKSHKYVLKRGKERIMMCYEPHLDRVAVRTLQQRLADISTNYVIKNFTDKTYTKIFSAFYKPMAKLLDAYCRYKNFNIPNDICFYYKGGNVFRILLSDITNIFTNQEYKDMMKRSDADFQIYINPSLPNNDKVREEVSLIVVYVLYNLKVYMRQGKGIRISNETDMMKADYIEELKKSSVNIDDVKIYTKKEASRDDFIVGIGKIVPTATDDKKFILIKKYPSILEGIDSSKSTYFISRNTSLDFNRRDNKRATFDLIRFRRNFKLDISLKNGEKFVVGAPFEIIDVSIPRGDDYGLKKMQANINKYVMEYTFNNNMMFRAPTLEYLLEDLHDLLFKQNEYPWQDIKYDKRMTRYFLTVIVYEIVGQLNSGSNIPEALQSIYDTFEEFVNFTKCLLNMKDTCSFDRKKGGYLIKLYEQYQMLHNKIIVMPDTLDSAIKEKKNLVKFGKKLELIFGKLMIELSKTIKNFNKVTSDDIERMYETLFKRGATKILGGH
jgi:hypothetical protein